jgi:hypothetical protein
VGSNPQRPALSGTGRGKDAIGPKEILAEKANARTTGDGELAVEQLEALAQIPGGESYGDLRLSPEWDPLRGDPRFEKIIVKMAKPIKFN